MSTPGFTAEVSLQRAGNHYIALQGFGPRGATVLPQRICNEQCLDDCNDLCLDPSDCQDLPPYLRPQCMRLVFRCHQGCIRRCCH
jgi:hypothetical protein